MPAALRSVMSHSPPTNLSITVVTPSKHIISCILGLSNASSLINVRLVCRRRLSFDVSSIDLTRNVDPIKCGFTSGCSLISFVSLYMLLFSFGFSMDIPSIRVYKSFTRTNSLAVLYRVELANSSSSEKDAESYCHIVCI